MGSLRSRAAAYGTDNTWIRGCVKPTTQNIGYELVEHVGMIDNLPFASQKSEICLRTAVWVFL
jgi:hypothetical protein